MSRFRRILVALAFGFVLPVLPASVHAGGGIGGGGVGGGGPATGGVPAGGGAPTAIGSALISVDNVSPPGHNYGFLDYYPRMATVRQGETVTWWWRNSPEPHTVTFLPVGTPQTEQAFNKLFPGGGGPIPDRDDGPNAPPYFPFNLYQRAGCGNSAYFPGTGACPWDGRSVLNSGVQFARITRPGTPASTFTARMNLAPGTYRYFCLVHGPHMSGFIRVVPAGAATPSRPQQLAAGQRQYATAVANTTRFQSGFRATSAPGTGGRTSWTVRTGADYGRVTIDEFIPRDLTVKAGDTVNWTPGFHTVTFGAGPSAPPIFAISCEAPGTADRPFTGSFVGCLGTELGLGPGVAPSGPPGRPYTGGFYHSGLLGLPRPHPWSVSFPRAGTYRYVCLVHPGMFGTITVR